jgi:hypothetical protein
MIEQAHEGRNRNRNRTGAITEDQITHRMIVSPDVKKIEDQLKQKAKRKGKQDGELRKSK